MKQKLLFVWFFLCSVFSSVYAQHEVKNVNSRDSHKKITNELKNETFATLNCNANTTICVAGVAGPFPFEAGTRTFNPVGCSTGMFGGNRFGYILLNIATTGPLNLLVDGNSNTGYIDVIVYRVPPGVSPCDAITNQANEIACNYATSSVGCTQFGNSFGCTSSVPAPIVTAGTQLMVIAHDYSDQSSSFTMQLGAGGAQTNPPDATVNALPPICIGNGPVQLTAVSNGGIWSGPGVSATGVFNPQLAGLGTHTISYSIGVAPCGSSDTQTFTVVESPIVTASSNEASICYGGTLEFTATATPGATYAWTGPGGWTSNLLNPTRSNVGPTANGNYTFTATLPNGCSDSETVAVNLAETTPPVVATQNISVNLDASGSAIITPGQIDNGSTDNCGIATRVLSQTTFTCANIGANSVTLTVSDTSGNSSTGTAIVTINDNTAPMAFTQNISVNLDATGAATITPAQIDNGSTDNCAIDTMLLDVSSFNCTQVGSNTVTLTVTDLNGNSAMGTATVTVNETIAPSAVTQNISVNLDATGSVTISPTQLDNGSSDNCAIATMTLDVTSFNCSQIGANTVTLTVTDVNGNSSAGTAIVTVNDTTAPTVITQNISVNLDATGSVTITPAQIDNGSSDNCAIDTITLDLTSFNCTQVGANTVTLTVTDVNGNSSTGTAIVTVNDVTAPTVVTQNISVNLDATGSVTITPAQIDNGSSDNCAIATMTLDVTSFNCSQIGANTVTLTVTDVNGNSFTGTAIVTVNDTTAPTVITQNISVNLDTTGLAIITPAQIDNGSSDNCGIATMTLDVTSFNCTQIGANTVTLTVNDINGNSSTGTAIVTVNDSIAPNVVTQNISVSLDASGSATITPAQIDNGSSDNCAIATMTLDVTSFNCTQVGTNTVTLTVTDVNGNSSTGAAQVTVSENIAPIVATQNITIGPDASGSVTITPAQIDNGSSDNCGIATMVLDQTTFNCTQNGSNTVTLTVTDVNGNSATGTATVTVSDTIAPVLVTQNVSVNLDATGSVTITPAQIDNGSSDNCAIDTMTLDVTSFNCAQVGANTVILTVTDFSGNVSTGTAIVTVNDIIAPTVVTQNISVNLDATGSVTITPAQIDNGSSDNCGIATMTLDVTSFNCTQVGANTVTLTVTDVNGNNSTGTAIVTVNDSTAPTVVTQNISVNLDASGSITITPAQIDNGSSDNCAIATMTLDVTSFNCTQVGTHTVTLTVTDVNGNSSTGTAIVTVNDVTAPIVVTQNISVNLDATGSVTITTAQIDNGSSDNCGIATMTLDVASFNCTQVGPNTVTLTVTDVNGNSSTGTAIVTVNDLIAPTVVTQNISVNLGATGSVTITPAQINNGSSDNCAIDTMALDLTSFNCTQVGTNTVTLTVTDVNGNSSTGTAIVTVNDAIAPTVVTQNISVNLDATGSVTITPAQINNGSSDNCAIATITLDITTFDCTQVGTNTVTLTVNDVNGNSSTGTAIVTVNDLIAPTVVTQNISVNLDATGSVTITPAQINNGSSDNCAIDTMTLDVTSFNCTQVGTNTVTLTVTDVNGNSSTGTAIVTVNDIIAPTVVTQNISVNLDATGSVAITPTQIDNGSSDNCGIATMTLDMTSFNCTQVGTNTVILTVTDVNGNSSTGTAIVTVNDVTAPTVVTQNISVNLDATGSITITPAQIDNGSSDNCAIDTMTLDVTSFSCTQVGANTVTLTVTDVNGNTATGTATVTVIDNLPPTAVAITTPLVINLATNGHIGITAAQIDACSTDNCGIRSMTVSPSNFGCASIGTHTVTLTVMDFSGNVSTATATVQVSPIPTPTVLDANPVFCKIDQPTVEDLDVIETQAVFFNSPTATQPLPTGTILTSGTYYVALRYGSCVGTDRLAINVTVNDENAPTGNPLQYLCVEDQPTLEDIKTNETDVIWYSSPNATSPLPPGTSLENNHTYYASRLGSNCESSTRMAVQVVLRYCDVLVHNAVTPNGDGKNDVLTMRGLDNFPDNQLQIFNRWGSLVYEAKNYGTGAWFTGHANKGPNVASGTQLLPQGTYFYIFSFINHDGVRQTKSGYIHLTY